MALTWFSGGWHRQGAEHRSHVDLLHEVALNDQCQSDVRFRRDSRFRFDQRK
jgi:hypothetical protein